MKKIVFTLIAFSMVVFAACNKLNDVPKISLEPGPAPESFTVNVPGAYETKTTLDGLKPKWVAGDEIRVYGHNTSADTYTDNAVYELKSGDGEGTAVFSLKSGEEGLSGTYDEFYAIYPAGLTATVTNETITLPRLNSSPYHLRAQNPTAGQIDPNLAIMTAVYDGSTMSFRHGVAYIKLTIPDASVTKVDINFTANCIADTPTYKSSTGALDAVANSSKNVTSVEGSFTQGESYYFAAIPRSGYTPTTTVITLTGGSTYTTTHFTKALEVGKVYDLGTPSKVPSISADNVTISADATSGTVNFTVFNLVDGGVVSKAVLSGAEISNLSLGDVTFNSSTGVGSIAFTCDKNEDSSEKTATVRLTYTYNTDQTVTKDVTITQSKAGKVEYSWDFSTSDWQTPLSAMGDAGTDISATWDITVDGLNFKSSKARWNTTYIQVVSAGSTSNNRFEFTAPAAGTVTVYFSNTGKNNDGRTMTVTDASQTQVGTVGADTTTKVSDTFDVVAGTVDIYPSTKALRVYQIDYASK